MSENTAQIVSFKEASQWVAQIFGIKLSPSNISYLVQYGHLRPVKNNGSVGVNLNEVRKYFEANRTKEQQWRERLGNDLNWHLSFENLREKERTKHVHRLHPYKGKFIPQLVEYFLDSKTDEFKPVAYFSPGDIILDPFCGSGTTLVQANELGIHAIGVDISAFNTMLSNIKVQTHNYELLTPELGKLRAKLLRNYDTRIRDFDAALLLALNKFNGKYFPSPEFRYKFRRGEIQIPQSTIARERLFLPVYQKLLSDYQIPTDSIQPETGFNQTWLLPTVQEELQLLLQEVNNIKDVPVQQIVRLIISRAVRSSRATTHSDLATLKSPVRQPYYCTKHYKICKPTFSLSSWFDRYSKDTVSRLLEFDRIRTETIQYCLTGDSRKLNIDRVLEIQNPEMRAVVDERGIKGIFTSPPYVGLIDYHEQHAYAYEIFPFTRRDSEEIGALSGGTSVEARRKYAEGISDTLANCAKFLNKDYDVFIVANDKYRLYPSIAEKAKMRIVKEFVRPVLNRTEKDKSAYEETIFHLKEA